MEINDITKMVEALTGIFEKRLNAEIARIIKENTCVTNTRRSEKTDQLYAALAAAQGEFKTIHFNRENTFFGTSYYESFDIIEAVKEALSTNSLSVRHETEIVDGQIILHTFLAHSSDQWTSTQARIVSPKDDVQSYGSTISYYKRNNLANILGITIKDDPEDDDGEISMIPTRNMEAKGTALNIKYHPKQNTETITPEQYEELQYELGEYPDIAEQILKGFRIQSLADLPKDKFIRAIGRIREIKQLRNGMK